MNEEKWKSDPNFRKLEKQIDDYRLELAAQKYALDQSSIVAITDEKGVIRYANDKFCEISKYSIDEIIGQTHRLVNSGHHSAEFFQQLWQTITKGKVWSGEIKNRAKDGSAYWVDTTIVPFNDSSGRPYQYVAIRNDITEKKKLEEEMEEDKKKLMFSEKMASLGILAAGIAHEIGNPLGALRGRLEMLEMHAKAQSVTAESAQKTAEVGIELVDRIHRIIKGLKAYARDGAEDEFTKVNLSEMITDILGLCEEKARQHGITVDTSQVDKQLVVECREAELGQVIVNLINNSMDAIQNLDEKWIHFASEPKGGNAIIRITDSGKGVPDKVKDRLFDPFFTTKPVGQGTGLGLSISANIVSSHRGMFGYELNDGHTSFFIQIPLTQSKT